MPTEPGQIYLLDLGMAAKTRLMLVVSPRDDDAPRALAICAPITTSTRNSEYVVSIGKPKFPHESNSVNVRTRVLKTRTAVVWERTRVTK